MPSPAEPILGRLAALHPKRIDLSLDRIERLLDRLDRPDRRLPPVVHVAGTNGKGSTLAFLDAMLQAAGRRTLRYISPHLVRFNERILIQGEPVDDERLAAALEACERANGDAPITFFEITTAAAFLIFAATAADVLLLETGMGGRLDATNVVARPLLTLITPISMDHEAFLGSTLAAIAGEKAGIFKPGVPALLGPQEPEALAVLEARARALGCPLLVHGRDWWARAEAERLLLADGSERFELPLPALPGVHQLDNAGLAVVAARRLGPLAPPAAAIAEGLRRARWPARLQRLRRGPMIDALGPDFELWLDGGHNPGAGAVLAASLPALARGRPVHLVLGMLASKDLAAFLRPLAPLVASVRTVAVPEEPAARDAGEEAAIARALGLRAEPAASPLAAARRIALSERGPGFVLICGSLYLAGHVLRDHD
ncbi:MAG: bifunctional folylpolyglutamate synthase/dihydrofolate synthase [Geminicoccaceae bacterium]|nr:bifunctional folylpolyglutamate synthase/dihydrofolate synthase [Geminicoccaceae bacterium]MCX8100734.1 bifunctional folylpolyglutamate synthase/dihydrofolate synthase [Geminicoccaceae bacterium]MDW8369426.1 folylpolyglutamate synthase/dihydrofolate synthase family protein [Geminicoccaceae bacterium]